MFSSICFACFEQNDLLLGQAMECAGMIGEAVGRTRFKSDGLAIMATLTVRLVSPDLCGKTRFTGACSPDV